MLVGVECGLILRPKRHIELFMAIFQHQSQPRPKRHSKGNDEESRQTPQRPHDHWSMITTNERPLLLASLQR
jgi:hypothetical protein